MLKLEIYGHSDDCIEIEGALREEFYLIGSDDEKSYLAFSDGTVLSVLYDKDGAWRFNRVAGGTSAYSKQEADEDDGTDRVTLEGMNLRWVTYGKHFKRVPQESGERPVQDG